MTKKYIANKLEIYDTDDVTLREYIDSNGFKAIRYRDEYVGGDWVAAAAAAAPDIANYTIAGISTRLYSFDGNNTEERISNSFEMPHDLALTELNAETVFIEAHIHWMPSTNNAGNVEWFFEYCYIPANAAAIQETTITALGAVAANEQYKHKLTSFKNTSAVARIAKPAAGFNLGDVILFNLRRTPNGANDTYPDDALLIKVALHVPTNDFGSRQVYIK